MTRHLSMLWCEGFEDRHVILKKYHSPYPHSLVIEKEEEATLLNIKHHGGEHLATMFVVAWTMALGEKISEYKPVEKEEWLRHVLKRNFELQNVRNYPLCVQLPHLADDETELQGGILGYSGRR